MTKEISPALSQKMRNMSIVCAFLVVTIHVHWPEDFLGLGWFVNQVLVQGVSRIAVPYFFVLSGYMLASHFDDVHWWRGEVVKRLRSLIVPFFVWGLLVSFLIACLSATTDYVAHRPFGTSLQLSPGWPLQVLGLDLACLPRFSPSWYLRCLFFLVVLSPMLNTMVEVCKRIYLASVFLGLLAFANFFLDSNEGLGGFLNYGLSVSGLFYFSCGIYLRRIGPVFISSKMALVLGVCSAGLLTFRTCVRGLGAGLPPFVDVLILPGLLYLVWFFMPSNRWPGWLTSASFPVYIMHYIFVCYLGALSRYFTLNPQSMAVTTALIGMVFPVALSAGMNRFMPSVASFLFAGRSLPKGGLRGQ